MKTYNANKGKFCGFGDGNVYVNMHKPRKKNPYKSIGKDHTNLLDIRKAKMKVVESCR
jgi:hypothetical protein